MRKLWPGIVAILASAAFAVAKFNRLPEQMVSHWGVDGTPNGWMSRGAFVFGIHGAALLIAVVLSFAPRVDPKYHNFASHQSSYWLVANASLVLLAGATVLSVGVNLGWNFHVEWLGFGIGLLFIIIGNVMTRVRPNWIFGARTPWTLSSDKSWRQTNRLTGYGFVLLGFLVMAVTAVRPTWMAPTLIIGSTVIAILSFAVSYIVWKNDSTVPHPK